MHLHQCFSEGFGFDVAGYVESLCVGEDGEEGTTGGNSWDEGAGTAFVPFDVPAAVTCITRRDGIGHSSDFHDF